jgi:uncharacterized protein
MIEKRPGPVPGPHHTSGEIMELSKYNIFGKIHNSENYFIVNQLSGQADILEPQFGKIIEQGEIPDRNSFVEKGYLVEPVQESILFEQKYREFIGKRDSEEIQIFFVPWYACNFACDYCYQDQYVNDSNSLEDCVIDAFYRYVDTTFSERRKYITIFGGEPLLGGGRAAETLDKMLTRAWSRNLDVAIVTNGYNLLEYVPMLSKGRIREIQVTLDGTEAVHDIRRPLRGGGTTFKRIVDGIDASLEHNLKINLRVVIDKRNIDNLPELARLTVDKKWVANPLFKTQIGRNYELHHCSSNPQDLFSRIELFQYLHNLIEKFPDVAKFHKPAFAISKFLSENGELPDALFDACPGCKSEWAFDYTGSIYSCTATVGKTDERLGTFYPEVTLENTKVTLWQERDITKNEQCAACSVNLICGGGCASVAKNKTGSLYGCDCRPVKELLSLGMSTYFRDEV